jgi:hypothetical protein
MKQLENDLQCKTERTDLYSTCDMLLSAPDSILLLTPSFRNVCDPDVGNRHPAIVRPEAGSYIPYTPSTASVGDLKWDP